MDSQKNTPTVDIKDYLLVNSPETYAKASNPYQVILQTSSDFIISRRKAKSEKELVILPSEGLFYFKEKEIVEEVTYNKLLAFLRDLRDDFIALDQVLWLPKFDKNSANRLISIITNKTYVAMARANVLMAGNSFYECTDYFEQDPDLFADLHSSLDNGNSSSYRACMAAAFEIKKRFGHEDAMFFAKTFKKSGIKYFNCSAITYQFNDMGGFFRLLDEPYNLSLRRLIEYAFLDSYAQGIVSIEAAFWKMYADYLSMQIKVHGEIQEKYPRYLKTAYDVMTLNAGLISEDANLTEPPPHDVAKLAHKGKMYSIIIPDTPRQIAEDGISLNHCVGANADGSGSHIIFMRKSQAPEQSLITLVFNNGQISQAVGLHRRILSNDERKFLEDWGIKNGVEIAA